MKLLIIDNYDSFTYNIVQIVGELYYSDFEIRKNNEISISTINHFDKILISPGPGIPSEAGSILQIIKKYSPTKSILGICLGHQAIAEVFGAHLIRMPSVAHGVAKRVTIIDQNDYIFQGIPSSIEVGLYHSWTVAENKLPISLKITARTDDGMIMAIAHGEFDVKGIQFHPESIMTKFGRKIISNWLRR
jgi:anthranilate synthase component II